MSGKRAGFSVNGSVDDRSSSATFLYLRQSLWRKVGRGRCWANTGERYWENVTLSWPPRSEVSWWEAPGEAEPSNSAGTRCSHLLCHIFVAVKGYLPEYVVSPLLSVIKISRKFWTFHSREWCHEAFWDISCCQSYLSRVCQMVNSFFYFLRLLGKIENISVPLSCG